MSSCDVTTAIASRFKCDLAAVYIQQKTCLHLCDPKGSGPDGACEVCCVVQGTCSTSFAQIMTTKLPRTHYNGTSWGHFNILTQGTIKRTKQFIEVTSVWWPHTHTHLHTYTPHNTTHTPHTHTHTTHHTTHMHTHTQHTHTHTTHNTPHHTQTTHTHIHTHTTHTTPHHTRHTHTHTPHTHIHTHIYTHSTHTHIHTHTTHHTHTHHTHTHTHTHTGIGKV